MTVSKVVEHDELAAFLEPSAAVEVGHSMKCLILQGRNTSTTPVKMLRFHLMSLRACLKSTFVGGAPASKSPGGAEGV